MSETDGELKKVREVLRRLQERVDGHDGMLKNLEDALVVHAFLEKRQSERIKEHAEFLARHEAAMQRHDAAMERIDIVLAEMSEKVNLLFDNEMRRQGGPEAQGPADQQ